MGKFGWSYPPVCSGPPEGPEPHPDSERVAEILEAAGVDQGVIDQVCAIVDALAAQALRECPQCLEAHERHLVQTETVAREAGDGDAVKQFSHQFYEMCRQSGLVAAFVAIHPGPTDANVLTVRCGGVQPLAGKIAAIVAERYGIGST